MAWLLACALVTAGASLARADDARSPFEALAEFVTTPPEYRGPTVPFPDAAPRPARTGLSLCSELAPLCVHAEPALPAARVQQALTALENAYAHLEADGWPLPHPDGTRGGGGQLDAYLTVTGSEPALAAADAPFTLDALDGAVTHVLLDHELGPSELDRCAAYAIAQAGLLAHDPAEPESARRALAAFAAWRYTGEPGCDASFSDAQAAPALGFVGEDPRQVAAAALLLAMVSRRHDAGRGDFVRGAAELARQRSRSPLALHARPDTWAALDAMLDQAGESLDAAAEEFAVARYFAPSGEGPLPRLPRASRIAARWAPPLAQLPKHLPVHEPALATYGSAYLRVDTSGARAGTQLEIWLRGERGARWTLTAVRVDGAGRELGQVTAPPRDVPDSFLPVELSEDTAELLIVVTKLPFRKLVQRPLEDDQHHFKLILNANQR